MGRFLFMGLLLGEQKFSVGLSGVNLLKWPGEIDSVEASLVPELVDDCIKWVSDEELWYLEGPAWGDMADKLEMWESDNTEFLGEFGTLCCIWICPISKWEHISWAAQSKQLNRLAWITFGSWIFHVTWWILSVPLKGRVALSFKLWSILGILDSSIL